MAEVKYGTELREYIKVVIKRKKVILIIFLVAVIVAAIINVRMPNIYEISMIIGSSIPDITGRKSQLYIDTPQNIEAKIRERAFNSKVIKALNMDPKITNFKFEVSQPENTDLIKVSTHQTEKMAELGLKVLNALFIELANTYKVMLDYKRESVDKQIARVTNDISKMEDSIKLNERKFSILEGREKDLRSELKKVKDNSERLVAQRDAILANKSETEDIMASLLYSNTIQQNIAYFNDLNDQLAGLRTAKESTITSIKDVKKGIDNLQLEIEKLNLTKDNIRTIRLVQKPEVSFDPVGPKRKQNVAIAGAVSLMLGTFLAFFVEYWEKTANNRRNHENNK